MIKGPQNSYIFPLILKMHIVFRLGATEEFTQN